MAWIRDSCVFGIWFFAFIGCVGEGTCAEFLDVLVWVSRNFNITSKGTIFCLIFVIFVLQKDIGNFVFIKSLTGAFPLQLHAWWFLLPSVQLLCASGHFTPTVTSVTFSWCRSPHFWPLPNKVDNSQICCTVKKLTWWQKRLAVAGVVCDDAFYSLVAD